MLNSLAALSCACAAEIMQGPRRELPLDEFLDALVDALLAFAVSSEWCEPILAEQEGACELWHSGQQVNGSVAERNEMRALGRSDRLAPFARRRGDVVKLSEARRASRAVRNCLRKLGLPRAWEFLGALRRMAAVLLWK